MHLEKYAGDDAVFDFDCTKLLAEGETISAPPTMSQWPGFPDADPALLVFGTPVVNTSAVTYPDGSVMAIGKGFQVRISGGLPVDGTSLRVYSVLGAFATTAGNVLTTKAPLWVLAPGQPAA